MFEKKKKKNRKNIMQNIRKHTSPTTTVTVTLPSRASQTNRKRNRRKTLKQLQNNIHTFVGRTVWLWRARLSLADNCNAIEKLKLSPDSECKTNVERANGQSTVDCVAIYIHRRLTTESANHTNSIPRTQIAQEIIIRFYFARLFSFFRFIVASIFVRLRCALVVVSIVSIIVVVSIVVVVIIVVVVVVCCCRRRCVIVAFKLA